MSGSNYKYKVYNGKVIKEILKNSKIYYLSVLFVAGILLGALFIKYENVRYSSLIKEIVLQYIQSKTGQGVFENFIASGSLNILLSVINILLGFSLIGYPLIIWLPFLRGLGLGVFSGYMYSIYKLSGLGYCALLVYPGAVISSFAFIVACCDSCDYSKNAYEKAIRAKGQFEKDETKIYLFRQFIYIVLCICSSLIEAIFAAVFSGLFKI